MHPLKKTLNGIDKELVRSDREHYSRRVSTPKILPPIDKIYMKTSHRIDLAPLEQFRDKRRYKSKRGYLIDDLFSGMFKFGGRSITIHGNNSLSEIQINPTEWDSLEGMIDVIRAIAGTAVLKINHLSCFVHLPLPLEDMRRSFTVPRIRKARIFKPLAETVTRDSGSASEIEFTGIYGSSRTVSFALYDAHKKHKKLKLPKPTTRLEVRFNSNRFTPVKWLVNVQDLTGERVFGKIELLRIPTSAGLKGRQKIYTELLVQCSDKFGLRSAISRIGQLDPKHGYTIMRKIKESMIHYEVSIPQLFDKEMDRFSNAKRSVMEKKIVIAIQANGVEKLSAVRVTRRKKFVNRISGGGPDAPT